MLKFILRSLAATAVATGIAKGVSALSDAYGVTARISVESGRVEVSKGFFSPRARAGVQGVVSDLKIGSGWIELRNDGRIAFSVEFPDSSHQRLRNIIQNA
jgi:hypothetical protein